MGVTRPRRYPIFARSVAPANLSLWAKPAESHLPVLRCEKFVIEGGLLYACGPPESIGNFDLPGRGANVFILVAVTDTVAGKTHATVY